MNYGRLLKTVILTQSAFTFKLTLFKCNVYYFDANMPILNFLINSFYYQMHFKKAALK